MILEFTVKNFRSIENQTFDLTASNKIKEFPDNIRKLHNTDILTSCILYGRNASGKSNVLNALNKLNLLVYNSNEFKYSDKIPFYEPFDFDSSLINSPSELEITFITKDNLKFRYGVAFDAKKIISESLYYFQSNKPAKLFSREEDNQISYGEHFLGNRKIIEESLLDNQLFLSKASTHKINLLNQAFLFLSHELQVYTSHEDDVDNILRNSLVRLIYEQKDDNMKINLDKLLKASDVNVTNFEVSKYDYSKLEKLDLNFIPEDIKENVIKKIEQNPYFITTFHKSFDKGREVEVKSFSLQSESLGTQRLLLVGGLILQALQNGGTVIIDELDKSLHPLLTRLLIKLFHSKKNNPNNAQLIFASHDSSLLDNEIFRRDQIYFVEKDYEGKTSIYRLSDIKGVRKDVPYDKWYLSGRFNAIPILEDLELTFEPRDSKTNIKNAS